MHEHCALVPNADRTAMLVVDGRLPHVRTEERRLEDALAALARSHGVRAPFLRVVRRAVDEDERLTTLFEVDATSAPGTWLPLDQVDPGAVTPVFADGVEQWLAEQRGAPIPPERPPWARPGWLAEASAWVAKQAQVEGEPELVRQWPLSAVYRYPTTEGPLYLKAVFTLFRHEPAVTAALADAHPGAVPDVLAIDPGAGFLLLREFGPELGDRASPLWADGVRLTARIQREWVERVVELASLGAPTRRLDSLRAEVEGVDGLVAAWERMDRLDLPDTIVHGDLHPWNATVEPDGVRVVDWSDAAVGPPFLDLGVVLFTEDHAEVRARLVGAYLDPWRDLLPEQALREAAALGEVLGSVYQSQSYRAINAAFEPDDRWLFAGEEARWRQRAIERAAKLY
jgi:Phosphotransferase enzyme family